jgi:imidazolonepropionase-like amidohydrolase
MLYRVADGVEEVTKAVREQLAARADLIKVMCSGGVFEATESEAWVQFTEAELSALITEAHAQGKPVAAHAHPAAAIRRAVELGVSSIEHGSYVDPESAEMMAARNVPMIPTFIVYKVLASHPGYPGVQDRAKRVYDSKFAHFLDAIGRGMPWGVGSDYSDLFAEPNTLIDEIAILSGEAGIPMVDVLVAATETNARIMGIEARVGTIAIGKDADLIGVRGDPLADVNALRRVEFTVRQGVLYDWRD